MIDVKGEIDKYTIKVEDLTLIIDRWSKHNMTKNIIDSITN